MQNRKVIYSVTILSLSLLLLPTELFCATADATSAAFVSEADKIKNFLFGPVMRVAGTFGGGYGAIRSIMAQDYGSLVGFVAVALGANLIPHFLNGLSFVSGCLLPF